MLLGVLVALLPEMMAAGMLTLLLAFIIGKAAWQISRKHGSLSLRTDQVFWSVREVLMYIGAVAALDAVGLLRTGY